MVCLEEKCKLLGIVRFVHTGYSGSERVAFYLREGKIYHQTTFFDPFDDTDSAMELKLCRLSKKEVDSLLQMKEVKDYPRFYWD